MKYSKMQENEHNFSTSFDRGSSEQLRIFKSWVTLLCSAQVNSS
ncbi:hypothetical protein STFR1_30028 [Bacillus vallismortis]